VEILAAVLAVWVLANVVGVLAWYARCRRSTVPSVPLPAGSLPSQRTGAADASPARVPAH
jgi:hypothetical protein